jgi:hypothetical protein
MMNVRFLFIAALALLPACSPSPVPPVPEQAIEVSHAALVGRCFQLLDSVSAPMTGQGAMWSGVVRLDTALANRVGAMRYVDGVYRDGWYDVTSLAPASDTLTSDTLRFSSHWSLERDRLLLSRSTGFTGEAISLAAAGTLLLGERRFFSDVVVEGARPRIERVRLVPRACPRQVSGGG